MTRILWRTSPVSVVFDWREPRLDRWQTDVAPHEERQRCVAFDFGIKRNILRLLHEHGFDVTVVPASLSSEDVLALRPDVLFLSNGPGDPSVPEYAIRTVRELIGKVPAVRHLSGASNCRTGAGSEDFQTQVWPPRSESSRSGSTEWSRRNHFSEPWLCRRSRLTSGRCRGHTHQPERPDMRGLPVRGASHFCRSVSPRIFAGTPRFCWVALTSSGRWFPGIDPGTKGR